MKDSFKDLTPEELLNRRDELTKQYFDLRMNMVIGHVENPLKKRELRRKIARINTIIHEHEIGLRKV
ncbi:MAG: 50S ribosomal protein L29 [Spirochaetia bacterium]